MRRIERAGEPTTRAPIDRAREPTRAPIDRAREPTRAPIDRAREPIDRAREPTRAPIDRAREPTRAPIDRAREPIDRAREPTRAPIDRARAPTRAPIDRARAPTRAPNYVAGLLASIASIALAPTAHAEFCGVAGLEPRVIESSHERVLPGDGGILVAAVPGMSHDERDVADQPSWTFRSGGTSSTPRRVTLAPGLVVYQARQDGSVALLDQEERPRATAFVTRRARPRLAAPVVTWTARQGDRVDVLLELASAPPDDAIAIVLAGKDGKARSWDFVDHDQTIQRAFKQRGCESAPAGTLPSQIGDEVTFFFVDVDGRPSARSRPIKIAGKTPSEQRLSPD